MNLQKIVSWIYPWFLLFGVNGIGIWIIGTGRPALLLLPLFALALGYSFIAERLVPYNSEWNSSLGDNLRDWIHATVNETMNFLTIASLPYILSFTQITSTWPFDFAFPIQVTFAILVLDFGITTAHLLSHRFEFLWRFHAVHHSVKRMYGFNGLMKHPIHQAIEMIFGTFPLLLMGLPENVALALGFCVAIQLILQHSNVDYRVGPFRYLLALNEAHRYHHQKWPGIGDVNFGLFTSLWDHIFGTFRMDPRSTKFSSEELGIGKEPDYPVGYLDQLAKPFCSITKA